MRSNFKINTLLIVTSFLFLSSGLIAQETGTTSVESSAKIKQIMAAKKAYNKNLKKTKGYKIQLFNGSEKGAYKVRDDFSSMFPKMRIKIEFFSPEWKVRVGNYKTRIDADRALLEIKEAFDAAIILPAMIEI